MAMSTPLRTLEEEVTCSICLDYLRDPVTIDCGHVFCQSCTTVVRPVSGGCLVCPLCKKPFKKENIRPVWPLASLVESIGRLKVDKGFKQQSKMARQQQDTKLCERHQEKLYYYCEMDGKLLCVMCRESWEHRSHKAILLEKAAQPLRKKILSHLSALRKDRDRIQKFQKKGEADIKATLKTLRDQKKDIMAEFEKSHQFLKDREQHLLDQLAKLEQKATEDWEKAKGSAELERLAMAISKLESKAQQPAAEFMQDTINFVNRYPRKVFWCRKAIGKVVQKRTEELSEKLLFLQQDLREFQGKLLRDLEYQRVSVTLDSRSVSRYLQLSDNGKCVTYSSLHQNIYPYPQQFDCEPGVLGSNSFTRGKVYWEVEVERDSWSEDEVERGEEEEEEQEEEDDEEEEYEEEEEDEEEEEYEEEEEDEEEEEEEDGYVNRETDEDEESEEEEVEEEEEVQESCMVGVAQDSMKRKGELSLRPEDGVWALRLSSGGIWANTHPEAKLCPSLGPRRIGIALDYEGGTVTFTNAVSQELIYTFTTTFTGRLVPFLWLRWPGTRLLLRS